jgi:hypothetical protein
MIYLIIIDKAGIHVSPPRVSFIPVDHAVEIIETCRLFLLAGEAGKGTGRMGQPEMEGRGSLEEDTVALLCEYFDMPVLKMIVRKHLGRAGAVDKQEDGYPGTRA